MAGERVDATAIAEVLKDEVIICQSCSKIVTNPVLYYNEDLIMQYQSAVNMESKTIEVDGGSSEQWDSYNIELAYIECENCGKEIEVPDDFDFDWHLEEIFKYPTHLSTIVMSNKKYSWWQILLNQPALDRAYDKIDRLEVRIDVIEQQVKNKQYMIDALDVDMEALKDEAILLQQDILFWHDMFESALAVPDIKADIKDKETRVNIYDDPPEGTFKTFPVSRVDLYMQLYPYDTWVQILDKIQAEVKEEIGHWRTDVSDCDDFATIMRSAVSLAHIDARAVKQGAFAWVNSRTHAYNAFIDDTWTVWIYEPQDGLVMGKLGETEEPYDTRSLRF